MDKMTTRLTLLEKAYENTMAKVIALKSIDRMVLPDGTVITAQRGDKIEIPRWMARVLEGEKTVSILWDDVSIEDIIRIHYREMQRVSLKDIEQLPDNFYWLVRDYLANLERRIRETPEPQLIEEKRRMQDYLNEIVDKRLQTIALSSLDEKMSSQISARLTPEEQVLLDELRNLIREWRSKILGSNSV